MWGAKGVGEAAITPMVSGLGIAIKDALGVRLKSPPFSPDKIIRALSTLERKE
jgi:CO/xanthine dehydrogenase Mo-binding subunit